MSLTIETMKALGEDAEFARLAAACLVAETASKTITPLVEAYEQKWFELFTHEKPLYATLLHNSPRNPDRHLPPPVITTPRDLYLCEDEERVADYYKELAKLHPQAGFTLKDPTHCPSCVGKHLLCKCEHAMLAYAESKLGIPFTELVLELRDNALRILHGIAIHHPDTERLAKESLPSSKADLNRWLNAA